jgi:two-component system OmpR family response regulator
MPARVLLADDDVELAAMLREYLECERFRVTVVHDGEAAVRHAVSGEHDVVVLDVMMPKMDGVEALRRIRLSSSVPVLMLTARGDDVDRIIGLELGADDYVPKPCTPRELTARLRAILRRLHARSVAGPLVVGPIVVWPGKRLAECAGKALALTSAEFNILQVLAAHAGQLVNKKQISEEGLGRPLSRYDRSIDVHLSSIRQKLGACAGLIHTIRGLGYQLAKE